MNLAHKHQRKSIRLKDYDYSQEGLYFITICCQDRLYLFGEILNGEMKLNRFGKIAHQEWINTAVIRKSVILHEFIIMPNHILGTVEIYQRSKEALETNITKFTQIIVT